MRLPRRVRAATTGALTWSLRRAPALASGRILSWGGRLLGHEPVEARATDGRRFQLEFPRDRGWESLYFTGRFETGTTTLLRRLLRPDDVTIDVGANIGWYTTLFARHCPDGHCHAFEPDARVFAQLRANCALNGHGPGLTLNNAGLSDAAGTATIYRFAGVPHGHSSLSPAVGANGDGTPCQVTTLDQYQQDHALQRIDLIKVDVEGAELMVLHGSQRVLSSPKPPMWLLEVNFDTSRAFGYRPRDLFAFLTARGDYHLFRVVGGWGAFLPMRDPDDCGRSDNVLCVPVQHLDRIPALA